MLAVTVFSDVGTSFFRKTHKHETCSIHVNNSCICIFAKRTDKTMIYLPSIPQHQCTNRQVILLFSDAALTLTVATLTAVYSSPLLPYWYPLINVSVIQAVMSWTLQLMLTIMTPTLLLPEQLQAFLDLSTLHSGRETEVVNNPEQLGGFILYFCCFEVVAQGLCKHKLSSSFHPAAILTFGILLSVLFRQEIQKPEKKTTWKVILKRNV